MSTDLAEALYQHLLDRFPADRDYPRKALYVEAMPPLVADVLGRTLDRWLEHELDGLESKWFDFEDPGVRAARAELVVALSQTARVPRGAWTETLRYAVGLVVRHLVTPARALTDATFEGETETLPAEVVRSRLYIFKAYSYLPEIADAYLTQKRLEAVDPDSLHGLLLRIDRRVTGDYGSEDWLRLLGPLFKLAKRVPDAKGVPGPLLEQFFAAKGQQQIASALNDRGDRVIQEAALHEILESTLVSSDPEQLAQVEQEPPKITDELVQEPEPSPTSSDPQDGAGQEDDEYDSELDSEGDEVDTPPEAAEEDVDRGAIAARFSDSPAVMPAPSEEAQPLWKRFTEGVKGPTVETAVPADSSATEADDEPVVTEPTDDDQRPVWERFLTGFRRGEASEPDSEEPSPKGVEQSLEDLERRVLGGSGSRQRKRFIRDLFRGDDREYVEVLRTLDQCESWSEASRVIAKDVFRRHGVDIYSETAIAFTDSVNDSFDNS